jgi:intracellular multiplication protein IcmF
VTGASLHHCRVQAIYFTSAEQGGFSTNHLDRKISQDYALTVQQYYAQSTNYRAYFIEGALIAFQKLTQRHYTKIPKKHLIQLYALAGIFGLFIAGVTHHYINSKHALDHLSKELLAYDFGMREGGQTTQALFHLSKAASIVEHYAPKLISNQTLDQLKMTIENTTNEQLQHDFLPIIRATIESILISPQESPTARYEALKIYLMLNTPSKRDDQEILHWFKVTWGKQAQNQNIQQLTTLLRHVLKKPAESIAINQQVVRDVRNYLNALPVSYFYYSLAKEKFSEAKESLSFPGFILPVEQVPYYFTKPGFEQTLGDLPNIVHHIEEENWVLERSDLKNLVQALEEAYCYDYVLWWQHFSQKILLARAKTYQEATQTTQILYESQTIQKLLALIQAQTSPDFKNQNSLFNRLIASQFTTINLISPASIREIIRTIRELQPLLMTLSVVNDEGRSAFLFSKMRFENNNNSNPLTEIYQQAQKFPEPISGWMKQLADNTWYLVMTDTKHYINNQWQQLVFQPYMQNIASRYPFQPTETKEVSIADFNHFFAKNGILQSFIRDYLQPFIDTSSAEWKPRNVDDYQLPLSENMINELMRANVITAMFFSRTADHARIDFSLQKMMLDPIIDQFEFYLGNEHIQDTQKTDHLTHFKWPESGAKLLLTSIEGQQYELTESGPWAFFKILQKINVLTDEQDSSMLQILFEVNGNAGRYLLKTVTPLNPFTPGILNGFSLNEAIASS